MDDRTRRVIDQLTVIANQGSDWQADLLALFPAGDDVGIQRRFLASGNITTYFIYRHLNDNRYWKIETAGQDISAGNNTVVTGAQNIVTLYKGLRVGLSTFSAGWTNYSGYPESYPGGDILYGNTAADYVQQAFTGTTIGVLSVAGNTGQGIALVTIDGNNTLANLLPTAQDLVTAGTLANTALVANGGTLNPTDRVWDQYNRTADIVAVENGAYPGMLFANNLTDAAHTVRVTITGYKNTASSGTQTIIYMFVATGPSTRASDDGYDFLVDGIEIDAGNTWEISYSFAPYTGGTNWQWLGHAGMAKIVSFGVTLDGVAVALDGVNTFESLSGSEVVITQVSNIRHPDTTTENLGTFNLTHTINKTTGLTIAHTVTWSTAGTYQTGYPCMMAVTHATFDRFKSHSLTESDLTDADNSNKLTTLQNATWCWDYNGNVAALMYISDLAATVNNWQDSGAGGLFWLDIDASWKKAYALKWTGGTFAADDVLSSECNYRVQWFTGGANAALAGKY